MMFYNNIIHEFISLKDNNKNKNPKDNEDYWKELIGGEIQGDLTGWINTSGY